MSVSAAKHNASYAYTYDANGNITSVTYTYAAKENESWVEKGSYTTTYTYDSQNQLIREDNQEAQKTWTWTYDDAGNILSKKRYDYTTGALGTVRGTVGYTYDGDWGDLLTGYGSDAVESDEIGNITRVYSLNPDRVFSRDFTWEQGRELATITNGSNAPYTYTYDANGMRTSRTAGASTYNYVYNGSQLTHMTVGNITMHFAYDASGTPMAMTFNGTVYYYATNLQGDVVSILDAAGKEMVRYTYDAWGAPLTTTGDKAATLGWFNPLRYRGYVYDRETDLYYLQSRYYDPQMGRFISADTTDVLTATPMGVTDKNLFAYCDNNPITRKDDGGYYWETVFDVISLFGSVVDVICNPDDVWAWVGLVADVATLVLPVVACGGTWVKAATKADDVVDALKPADDLLDMGKVATTGSPNSIGKIGEELAGINPKEKIPIQVNGRTRIPDALTETTLVEVKNVKYISNTSQLRDFATFAKNTGRTQVLYVRPTTKVAKTVLEAGWDIKYLW